MDSLVDVGLRNAAFAVPFALVALVAGRLFRRPALTHALWLLVLLRLLLPPLWSVTVPRPAALSLAAIPEAPEASSSEYAVPSTELAAANVADSKGDAPIAPTRGDDGPQLADETTDRFPTPLPENDAQLGTQDPSSRTELKRAVPSAAADLVLGTRYSVLLPGWRTLVATGWLTGTLALLTLTIVRIRRFERALRRATPAPESLQRQIDAVARKLGLRRGPRGWLLNGRVSPLLWGVCRPRLILPVSLWDGLDAGQRAALLAHELAHYRRGDHHVRGLELLAAALFWWHPAVWLARGQLREAEEQCCDAWVVRALPEARRAYAEALVDTVDFLS